MPPPAPVFRVLSLAVSLLTLSPLFFIDGSGTSTRYTVRLRNVSFFVFRFTWDNSHQIVLISCRFEILAASVSLCSAGSGFLHVLVLLFPTTISPSLITMFTFSTTLLTCNIQSSKKICVHPGYSFFICAVLWFPIPIPIILMPISVGSSCSFTVTVHCIRDTGPFLGDPCVCLCCLCLLSFLRRRHTRRRTDVCVRVRQKAGSKRRLQRCVCSRYSKSKAISPPSCNRNGVPLTREMNKTLAQPPHHVHTRQHEKHSVGKKKTKVSPHTRASIGDTLHLRDKGHCDIVASDQCVTEYRTWYKTLLRYLTIVSNLALCTLLYLL